ncbi:hypothetical protein KP509_18G048800 [Ceratopteris richardii]|uniref:SHSP domain-containing protein n=1 Tax=Ceratopteris richardii TaxID=49495 RepID=A0A8T2SRG0_CERRI|nr:hypothetical protein KP509_18G048800 [Ceratopteris richardii]
MLPWVYAYKYSAMESCSCGGQVQVFSSELLGATCVRGLSGRGASMAEVTTYKPSNVGGGLRSYEYDIDFDSQHGLLSSYGGTQVDWLEDENNHVFIFNLPGVSIENVRVRMLGTDIFELTGEHSSFTSEDKLFLNGPTVRLHIKERPTGSFIRRFQLPGEIRVEEVTFFIQDGVLRVTLPKRRIRHIRNIPIISKF